MSGTSNKKRGFHFAMLPSEVLLRPRRDKDRSLSQRSWKGRAGTVLVLVPDPPGLPTSSESVKPWKDDHRQDNKDDNRRNKGTHGSPPLSLDSVQSLLSPPRQLSAHQVPARRAQSSIVYWSHRAQHNPASSGWTAGLGRVAMVALGVAIWSSVITACGASELSKVPSAVFSPPKNAVLSWFAAIDRKDKRDALNHFEPARRAMMNWDEGRTSTWPTFSNVRCRLIEQDATDATVYCTFAENGGSPGNPDSFWTVSLQRVNGRWLIANYGQG
jgi:hypothetical protein